MKYCSNCGTQLEDDARFCTNCGSSYTEPVVAEESPAAEAAAPLPTPEPVPETPTSEQEYYYETREPVSKGKSITGLVFGAVGLGLSWLGLLSLFGLISTALCIVGLIVSGSAYRETGSKMARIGRILALIGLIVSVVLTVIFTILYIAAIID